MQDLEEKIDDDTLNQILGEEDAGFHINEEHKNDKVGEDRIEEEQQKVDEDRNTRLSQNKTSLDLEKQMSSILDSSQLQTLDLLTRFN